MQCGCIACQQVQNPSHSNIVPSQFTTTSPQGILTITPIQKSEQNTKFRLKVNKVHGIIDLNESIKLPTKTIDDVLEIGLVEGDRFLVALGTLQLNQLSFDGSDTQLSLQSNIEGLFSQVALRLEYLPITPMATASYFSIYRKSFTFQSKFVYFLQVQGEGVKYETALRDHEANYRDYVWHQATHVPSNLQECTFILKEVNKKTRRVEVLDQVHIENLQERQQDKPVFIRIKAPSEPEISVELYLQPVWTFYMENVNNDVTVRFFEQGYKNLEKLKEAGVLDIECKSVQTFNQENAQSMKIIELIQFTYDDFYDMHFKTYDLKDKIVFKIGTMSEQQTRLNLVGIIHFQELNGITQDKFIWYHVQLGPEYLQFQIKLKPYKVQKTTFLQAQEVSQSHLTYKSQNFFDVEDLMKYKINRINTKNTHVTVQKRKIMSRNEMLSKTVWQLEHAQDASQMDSILSRVSTKPSQRSKTQRSIQMESTLDTSSICVCGKPEPQFRGYCGECVTKLKEEYEKVLQWFTPIQQRFTNFTDKINSVTQRKILFQNKIKRLEERLQQPLEFDFLYEDDEANKLIIELQSIENEVYEMKANVDLYQQQVQEKEDLLNKQVRQQKNINQGLNEKVEQLQQIDSKQIEEIGKINDRLVGKFAFFSKHKDRFFKDS